MELVFELSGEQPELGRAEIRALLEANNKEFTIKKTLPNLYVIETERISKKVIKDVFKRLGFVHAVYLELISTKKIEEVFEYAKKIEFQERYCVRAKRIDNSLEKYSLPSLEKKIGSEIKGSVDLDLPKELFKLFLSGKHFVFTKKIYEIDRSRYRERKPHKRNFFKPGAIEPELARAIINLTRIKRGNLLDLFTGTGSFLLESSKMNISSIGLDTDFKTLKNAKKNFKELNKNKKPDLALGDAKKLPFSSESFDAVVADPPYGRSSVAVGNAEKTYNESIKESIRVLKRDSYLCFISSKERVDYDLGLKEIERYEVKEHRSLTRVIKLFRRKK